MPQKHFFGSSGVFVVFTVRYKFVTKFYNEKSMYALSFKSGYTFVTCLTNSQTDG